MSMNYPYDPEQVDAPVDVVEGVAQRTHTSLLKGIKNYLRTIANGVAATVSGTVTANQGNQNAGGAAAWHVQAANLDLAITALRDAITGAGVAAKTLANIVTSLNGGLPAALGAGGGLKVDGSGTALPVSGAVTVSGTATVTQGAAGAAAWPMAIDHTTPGTSDQVLARPFAAMLEGGLTELVGINEQVDQNELGEDIGVGLGGAYSGEILSVCLYSTEDGGGAVQTPSCNLMIFDADPATAAGDAALSAAARVTQIGRVDISSSDWKADANGASAFKSVAIPFHSLATLYFVLRNEGASINDAAGDDEQIEMNFWYRRDS